nr:recombinase family protein [Corynebacterium sp. HMSC074H12]
MGYARVSTTDQNPERQHTQLKAAGAVRIYTDHRLKGHFVWINRYGFPGQPGIMR